MATKLTVGILPGEDAEATDLRRWLSEDQTDIRDDTRVAEEVLAFITEAGAKSVVMAERIIGCPHHDRQKVQRHLTSAQTNRVLRAAATSTWRTAVEAA